MFIPQKKYFVSKAQSNFKKMEILIVNAFRLKFKLLNEFSDNF